MTTISGHLTEAQAQRLLDGQLDPSTDAGVEAHLDCCEDCCALVDSFSALGDALAGLTAPELPADFTAGVMCCIDGLERAAARERRAGLALAAGVVLVAGLAIASAGAGGLGYAVSAVSEQLDLALRAFRVGAGVLPGLLSALRLPLLLATSALSLPLYYGLSRLMPAPRTSSI
jgi:anti-sigma factor RsiW